MANKKGIIIVLATTIIAVGILLLVFNKDKGSQNNISGNNKAKAGTNITLNMSGTTNSTTEPNTTKSNNDTDNQSANRIKTPVKVKAVYLSGDSAGSNAVLDRIIELSKTTELNAVVIDVKEAGLVNYDTGIPEVRSIKAFEKKYNPEEVIKKLHNNNIYVIGRIVCFRDTTLAEKRPDLAVKKVNGQIWREGKMAWTNAYLDEVQQYNINIAKEAADKGFDEIQFDYVRFPTTRKGEVNYGNVPPRADAISSFLEKASKEIHNKNIPVSADVFAIICESPTDGEAIGQVLEKIGENIDYISPMVYPSHYANAAKKGNMANGVGQSVNGVFFKAPDLEPYKVVYNTLLKTEDRMSKDPLCKAKIRPYLQAFSATFLPSGYWQKYGPEQVKDQMKAVDDTSSSGWILWDPRNSYKQDYFVQK
ncbi:MAG: putative glycoside hydrolase [Bacillota bacterium]|nr:putative glycoside hydrolase [Bacillota bacterium]